VPEAREKNELNVYPALGSSARPKPGAAVSRLATGARDRYGFRRGGVAMRVEMQLSAFLENRAGALARLAADLARHGISIRALTIANLVDHSLVRLVVSEPRKALHLLGERGVLVVTSQVLAVEMEDEAGALAAMAQRLGRAGVNIDYAYGSGPVAGGRAAVYLHVSNLRKARAALAGRRPPARRRR
jgi:hypothetical protein